MKDITPKRTSEAWRGYVIHTSPWSCMVERYRNLVAIGHPVRPLAELVGIIADSKSCSEVFGGNSMFDVLLSDSENFRSGDSVLRITYDSHERKFGFYHTMYSQLTDHKACDESDALVTLRLFLRLKFGVLMEPNQT